MPPLRCPPSGRLRRASVLLAAAVLLCAVPVGSSLPAGRKCPLHIDCAKEGRQFCSPGSSHCGPCLSSLEENQEGLCVAKRRHHHHHGKVKPYPDLDEEIDYLHSVIEKQEVSEIRQQKKQSKHPAAAASQADGKKSETDASRHKQKSQVNPDATTAALQLPAASALPNTPTPQPRATGDGGRAGPIAVPAPGNDDVIILIISLCVVVGTVAVILATVCYVKLQRQSRLAEKVDYPAYGGTDAPPATSNGTSVGDKTLAHSAQMYHYQHQKQQMLSAGNHKPEQKVLDNEVTSDEEEVGGDFTVYECPGLAPTGEMEVKNPLFDDSTVHYQENQK